MKFSLIICTYMRSEALIRLLDSVNKQTLYPDEILIIDGSVNQETQTALSQKSFQNLKYFLVSDEDRGLTRQRNFGISKVADTSEIVCFLDDDTILEKNYFEEVLKTFQDETVGGVGGVAMNENRWKLVEPNKTYSKKHYFIFDNYVYKEGQRNVMRNYLGLQSNLGPGMMPAFSHGRTCGFPLTDKVYEVDLLIGMAMSFRKCIFESIQFSKYFEGYGLYEDADFSLQALAFGRNVINTKAKLSHYHEPSGRPDHYHYGKIVVRNGWYVWRIKNPKPLLKDKLKWHTIILLLTAIRFTNSFTTKNKKAAFMESLGRLLGYFGLFKKKHTPSPSQEGS